MQSRRALARSVVALVGSAQLAVVSPFGFPLSTAADSSLAIPGTTNGMPDQTFVNREVENFVTPAYPSCVVQPTLDPCTPQAVDYPASLWPLTGLQSDTYDQSVNVGLANLDAALRSGYAADPPGHFYVVGYSQGSTVGSYYKNNNYFPDGTYTDGLPPPDQITFVFAANPNRPNGGIATRPGIFGPMTIPILGLTVGVPAATDRGVKTTDIVIQYDGVSDVPAYPINLLADANAVAGILFIHPTYVYPNTNHPDAATDHPYGYPLADFQSAIANAQTAADNDQCAAPANHCQVHGDTTYITLPTQDLPILVPLRFIGEQLAAKTGLPDAIAPLADLIQPAMKVLIETGYDRSDYGKFTPFQVFPLLNPAKLVTLPLDLALAAIQGIRDALIDIANGGHRPGALPTVDPITTPLSLFEGSPAPSPTTFAPTTSAPTSRAFAPTTLAAPSGADTTSGGGTTGGDKSGDTTSGGTSSTTSGGTTLSVSGGAVVTSAGTTTAGTSGTITGDNPGASGAGTANGGESGGTTASTDTSATTTNTTTTSETTTTPSGTSSGTTSSDTTTSSGTTGGSTSGASTN
jgi:hypothetical protein